MAGLKVGYADFTHQIKMSQQKKLVFCKGREPAGGGAGPDRAGARRLQPERSGERRFGTHSPYTHYAQHYYIRKLQPHHTHANLYQARTCTHQCFKRDPEMGTVRMCTEFDIALVYRTGLSAAAGCRQAPTPAGSSPPMGRKIRVASRSSAVRAAAGEMSSTR
ncbi:hypothetical protein EVAR_70619_1 [Eumeta japonica]|uniref:Uncharacterized protein n=1 Tax=Eumeta variegata TaxID=151549 RepID=A0A4C2A5V6_EUMVA|nr:hypothetical protein EVAR_70619_1 [Eumeta japonica]